MARHILPGVKQDLVHGIISEEVKALEELWSTDSLKTMKSTITYLLSIHAIETGRMTQGNKKCHSYYYNL